MLVPVIEYFIRQDSYRIFIIGTLVTCLEAAVIFAVASSATRAIRVVIGNPFQVAALLGMT